MFARKPTNTLYYTRDFNIGVLHYIVPNKTTYKSMVASFNRNHLTLSYITSNNPSSNPTL